MNKGVFTISFDTELIWGRVQLRDYSEFIKRAEKVHETLPKLLKILDTYKVPVTWAIVGHMMLSECAHNRIKHPEIKRPKYSYMTHDWFEGDPGTNEKRSPAWYGASLLKLIKSYKYHDIGSHTFSHFCWGDEGFDKECAESDLKAWDTISKKNKIKATSFVFPKNSINYLNLLPKYGFTTFRGIDVAWYSDLPKSIQSLAQAIDLFLPTSPSANTPTKEKQLLNIPGSLYFPSGRGNRKYIPQGVRAKKAMRGIDHAIESKAVFHLWTHPIDFSDDTPKLLSDFENIVKYASAKRALGELEILTMAGVTKKMTN